jgi:GAF domain-containing protein
MAIGALRGAADAVLPAARAATVELAVLEASDLQVVRGEARIVVRFTADDREIAEQVAAQVAAATSAAAEVTGWRVTERTGGRWA